VDAYETLIPDEDYGGVSGDGLRRVHLLAGLPVQRVIDVRARVVSAPRLIAA
jgi:hypothetical protein